MARSLSDDVDRLYVAALRHAEAVRLSTRRKVLGEVLEQTATSLTAEETRGIICRLYEEAQEQQPASLEALAEIRRPQAQ